MKSVPFHYGGNRRERQQARREKTVIPIMWDENLVLKVGAKTLFASVSGSHRNLPTTEVGLSNQCGSSSVMGVMVVRVPRSQL